MPRSSYYYKSKQGKRGRKPSEHTTLLDGGVISNESVAIAIRILLNEEFMVAVGYVSITEDLKANGFLINKKKVYRIMKEHRLMLGCVIRTIGEKRKFVSWRVREASAPMEQLCMDIKYIPIAGEHKNALLLTVLDVYTRSIIGQVLSWQIRKEHVIWLINGILNRHQTENITIRNDNGSQFIAKVVRELLSDRKVNQEFTHVSTPEENCFIEAYHSIVEKQLLRYHEFSSIEEAQEIFDRWKTFYNERRRHGSIGRTAPMQKWREYESAVTTLRLQKAAKPEQTSRPAAKRLVVEQAAALYSLDFCGGEAIFADSDVTQGNKQPKAF